MMRSGCIIETLRHEMRLTHLDVSAKCGQELWSLKLALEKQRDSDSAEKLKYPKNTAATFIIHYLLLERLKSLES